MKSYCGVLIHLWRNVWKHVICTNDYFVHLFSSMERRQNQTCSQKRKLSTWFRHPVPCRCRQIKCHQSVMSIHLFSSYPVQGHRVLEPILVLTFTPKASLDLSINPIACMSLHCGRKLEYFGRTHTSTRITCKVHTERTHQTMESR